MRRLLTRDEPARATSHRDEPGDQLHPADRRAARHPDLPDGHDDLPARRRAAITLPEADADPAKQRPREINVGIDAQGRYVIDRTVFNFTTVGALADMLRKSAGDAKEPVVIINADANATHQSVIHVMEAARAAGLTHITFATQTPTGQRAPAKK